MKTITIHLTPKAKRDDVSTRPDGTYSVSITAKPVQGKANAALIQVLADHFHIHANKILIKRGLKAKTKIVEIWD